MFFNITQSPTFSNYHANVDYLSGISSNKNFIFLNIPEDKVSIPLIKRYLCNNLFDLFSPIGFQPYIQQTLWPNLLERMIGNLSELGVVSLYILCKNDLTSIIPPHGVDLNSYRKNYYIDLRLSYDQWLIQQKSDSRQRLRKAIYTTRYEIVETRISDKFIDNYCCIAKAKKFPAPYLFSGADFNRITNANNIVYLELQDNKDFRAGGFFGCDRGDVDYLFAANDPKYKDAIRLLINEARKYFKVQKFDRLYLGGGIREGDSLAIYKQRMGTISQACSAIRAVINIEQAEQIFGRKFSSDWFSGFFPPYVKEKYVG
jgi:hypothetical protein